MTTNELRYLVDNHRTILIPEGSIFVDEPILITKSVRLIGVGNETYIYNTNDNPIFKIEGRNEISFENMRLDAQKEDAVAIHYTTPTSVESFNDLKIRDVSFRGNGNGLVMIGCREPLIERCTFEIAGIGIKTYDVANPKILNNYFKSWGQEAKAIFIDGYHDSGFSCGALIKNNTVLGFNVGIQVVQNDWANISDNMIDYCDIPISILSQDQLLINNNYLGSRGNSGVSRCIDVDIIKDSNGKDIFNQHIQIKNNQMVTYADTGSKDRICVDVNGVNGLQITGNNFTFWNKKDIRLGVIYSKIIKDNISMGV